MSFEIDFAYNLAPGPSRIGMACWELNEGHARVAETVTNPAVETRASRHETHINHISSHPDSRLFRLTPSLPTFLQAPSWAKLLPPDSKLGHRWN